MDVKQEIELILEELKKAGFDRSTIEEELGYSKNYINQSLSRGGNPRILSALKLYAKNKFYNKQHQEASVVNADSVEYKVIEKWEIEKDTLINDLFEEKDRAIKRAEEKALKAEEQVKKLEEEIQKLQKEKLKLLDIISNLSKEKPDNVRAAAYSNQNNQQLPPLNDQTHIK
jgi:predicted RNase H-like nuclease (RuvC/YqgF family)